MPLHVSHAMTQRIIRSYPFRLVFVVGALAAAVVIIHYRLLVKRDFNLLRANRQQPASTPLPIKP